MLRSFIVAAILFGCSQSLANDKESSQANESQSSFREGFLNTVFPMTREMLEPALISADGDFDWSRVRAGRTMLAPPDDFRKQMDLGPIHFDLIKSLPICLSRS